MEVHKITDKDLMINNTMHTVTNYINKQSYPNKENIQQNCVNTQRFSSVLTKHQT
jgi:hypothetical protein